MLSFTAMSMACESAAGISAGAARVYLFQRCINLTLSLLKFYLREFIIMDFDWLAFQLLGFSHHPARAGLSCLPPPPIQFVG